jgi:hypothetical protein
MGNILRDPGDPDRTARPDDQRIDDLDDVVRIPRLVAVAAAAVVFVVGVTNFALGQVGFVVAAVSVGLLVFGAGLSWLAMERRRVRQAEREWLLSHPGRR